MKELIKIQSELKAPKNQYNKFGKYKYRNQEDILEAVKPLLLENECLLLISDKIIEIEGRYYIEAKAELTNKDGQKASVTALAREAETKKGMDESQITGSASSYARKYALNGLFLIDDTKDADNEINFNDIKKLLKNVKTIDELEIFWQNYENLQSDKEFIKLVSDYKKELKDGTK